LNMAKRLTEKDVGILQLISPSLRAELRFAICGDQLKRNKFIRVCHSVDDALLFDICLHALLYEAYNPGEEMFEPNSVADGAYMVHFGSLQYQFASGASKIMKHVMDSAWIAELAIWTSWTHRGWLEARTQCEVVKLRAAGFYQVLRQGHPDAYLLAEAYRKTLCVALAESDMQDQDDLSMGIDHQSIVMCMPVESRALMSKPAVDVLAHPSWSILFSSAAKNRHDLIAEVEAGKCDLNVDDSGNVHRVAFVVLAKLQQPSGQLLVQVGKLDSKRHAHVKCQLPGTKVRAGELPRDALARFFNTKLRALVGAIEITDSETAEYTEESKAYGLHTKYSKMIFKGTVQVGDTIIRRPSPKMRVSVGSVCCEHQFFLVEDSVDKNTYSIFCWMNPVLFEGDSSHIESKLQTSVSSLDFGKLHCCSLSHLNNAQRPNLIEV